MQTPFVLNLKTCPWSALFPKNGHLLHFCGCQVSKNQCLRYLSNSPTIATVIPAEFTENRLQRRHSALLKCN
ncbi:hypothetical protein L596_026140 [Steinernema carpocapsae]|uniref:Uncharacterized protein n=1 Tax=Steinernema carpocapsae TaxID=34508 RepID=A0A4U5M1G5_STECR|nr:hypothetical protein L596_026140 [Steinernema carpocapsae]